MSDAQHVWAHGGNVQSFHRRLMTSVDRENVCRFSEFLSQLLVPSLHYRRFPLGIFFGILVLSSGKIIEVTINLQTPCAVNDRRLGFFQQCDSSPMNHLRRQLQPFLKRA